jgi:hypothetical protein
MKRRVSLTSTLCIIALLWGMLHLYEKKSLAQDTELRAIKENKEDLKEKKARLLAKEAQKGNIEDLNSSPLTKEMTRAQMEYLEVDKLVVRR